MQNNLKSIVAGLILVMIGGIGIFLYFFPSTVANLLNKEHQEHIYLSLVPLDGSKTQTIYEFDVHDGTLSELDLSKTPIDIYRVFSGSFTDSGDKMAFSAVTSQDKTYSQIYSLNVKDSSLSSLTKGPFEKKEPQWSPDGNHVTYVSSDLGGSILKTGTGSEDWSVFVSDLNGNDAFISRGYNPHFVSNNQILLVKNDGLYLYSFSSDFKTVKGNKIWGMESGVTDTGMKIGVSLSKNMIAWSVPGQGNILIIKISSWTPFQGQLVDTIKDSHSFWPVFSPDEKYLAAEEINWNAADEASEHPRLIVYDLVKKEKKVALDLSRYYQEALWVNDWK